MKCKNCLGDRCRLNGEVCPHLVYDGKCEFANSSENETPTFAQMYEIYASVAKSDDIMKERTLFILKRIALLAGLKFEDRAELTVDEWELVYTRLKNGTHPFAHEGGYDPETINYYFSRYRAAAGCSCKEIRIAYKRRGLVPPDCDVIPEVDYSEKKRDIESLSYAQVKTIKDKMAELSKSHRICDYNRYMRLFFGLYFGCRPCDIHRLTWDCIKKDPFGGYYLEYVPSKTARKTRERPAGSPIHPALMSELLPLVGKYGKDVLVHNPKMAREISTRTNGRYVRNFKELERWVGRFMRSEVKVTGYLSTYVMRRDCGKYNTEKHGPLYATKLLGNSPSVLFKHYVSVDKLRLK